MENGQHGIVKAKEGRKRKKDVPRTKIWVRCIKPRTLMLNMVSARSRGESAGCCVETGLQERTEAYRVPHRRSLRSCRFRRRDRPAQGREDGSVMCFNNQKVPPPAYQAARRRFSSSLPSRKQRLLALSDSKQESPPHPGPWNTPSPFPPFLDRPIPLAASPPSFLPSPTRRKCKLTLFNNTSTFLNSSGILSNNPWTCFLSLTSNVRVTILPPLPVLPSSCATLAAAAISSSWGWRRAVRIRLAPARAKRMACSSVCRERDGREGGQWEAGRRRWGRL